MTAPAITTPNENPARTRREAVAILNRMGIEYDAGDVAEVMSGDAWVPVTDAEWSHYAEARA
jgi:hypothetical protein